MGSQSTTTTADCYSAITPSMRSAPTTTFTGLIISDSVGFDAVVSSITTISNSGDSVYLGVSFPANGAQFRPVNFRGQSSNTGAFIAFSAEL